MHPMDFAGSNEEKQRLTTMIEESVNQSYCKAGFDKCQQTTLTLMMKSELNAFKALTMANNRELLDKKIATYCNTTYPYTLIKMMYDYEASSLPSTHSELPFN
ncbi:hypothetical protein [Pseudomonas arsenicoxydans]|nr:hypothetical protein [Pseudomonas arsenicoxydans]